MPDPINNMQNGIAFVIDGTVEEMIYVGDRFNAILTSNPTIVSVASGVNVQVGYTYGTDGTFTAPPTPEPTPIVDPSAN
jgi:hypothetical protein